MIHDQHTFSAIHAGTAHPAAVDAPLPLDATPAAGATYLSASTGDAASDPAPETGGMEVPQGLNISPVDQPKHTFVPVGAMEEVLALRWQQIHVRGHTAEADDALDLFEFSKRGGRLLHRQNESASLHRLESTQRDALKLAAFSLALAESCQRRLDAIRSDPTQ